MQEEPGSHPLDEGPLGYGANQPCRAGRIFRDRVPHLLRDRGLVGHVQPNGGNVFPGRGEYLDGRVRIHVDVVLGMGRDVPGIEVGSTHDHEPAHLLRDLRPKRQGDGEIRQRADGHQREIAGIGLCQCGNRLGTGHLRFLDDRCRNLGIAQTIPAMHMRCVLVRHHQRTARATENGDILPSQQGQHP